MPPFAIYLIKIIICSGLFYGYYRAFLYNKPIHNWNRYFILFSVIISLTLPLIEFRIAIPMDIAQERVVQLLSIVDYEGSFNHEENISHINEISITQIASVLYSISCCFFLIPMLIGFYRLYQLDRSNSKEKVGKYTLIHTSEKDAPFTFFYKIFWNSIIDPKKPAGKRILQHELIHARQLHSVDQLFLSLVIVFFWCNPFYWLMRKELRVVHEFIADKGSIKKEDLGGFSQMILTTVFPGNNFGFNSHFYFSSLKRRMHMLGTTQNTRVGFLNRFLLIPVLLIMVAAFTIRQDKNALPQISLKAFTLVIDPGHDGASGAIAQDGTTEGSINLLLAKKIVALNSNNDVRILLTRDDDATIGLKERVQMSVAANPDAFISLHMSALDPSVSGFDMFVGSRDQRFGKQAQLLGSAISKEIQVVYTIDPKLKKRENKGIWVLDAPEISYPGLLIECGNLNNNKDLAFMKDPNNQDKIARQILKGIYTFAAMSQTK